MSESVGIPIRMVHAGPRAEFQRRDLARGWNILLVWGGPLAWMLGSEILDAALRLPAEQFGLLLVVGTLWMGVLCLANALRCGRSHCWFDGALLPALAAVGFWNLVTPVRFSWTTYLSAFWAILIASVILECAIGSYPNGSRKVRGG